MTASWRDQALVAARSWIGTPYHSGADLKGIGVDCGKFVFCVYLDIGLLGEEKFPSYDERWMLARENGFLEDLFRARFDIVETPCPGDAMLFRIGRNYAHAGIVTEVNPLTIIHAASDIGGVLEEIASRSTRFLRHLDTAIVGSPKGAA